MEAAHDMRKLAHEIISSYEHEIMMVGNIMEALHKIIEDFKAVEKEAVRSLRETLSSVGSLRKADFDRMVGGVFDRQGERQARLMDMLRAYMLYQKEAAGSLKRAISNGDIRRLQEARQAFREERTVKEQEIKAAIWMFKCEYEEFAGLFQDLVEKGKALNPREFREALVSINALQERRLKGPEILEGKAGKPRPALGKGRMAA